VIVLLMGSATGLNADVKRRGGFAASPFGHLARGFPKRDP
jgi:hypothetical protein